MTPLPILDLSLTGPAVFLALVLATYISEDLTCLTAGLMVADGRLGWFPAVAACFVGIVSGDSGIWLFARMAGQRRAVQARLQKWLSKPWASQFLNWFGTHAISAVMISRFLPGTRVPLLLAAGVARQGGSLILVGVILAALIWTPFVVLSVAYFGEALPGWVVLLGFGIVVFGFRAIPPLFSPIGRAKLVATVSKLWRWEFWPAWLFYLPLVPWFLILAVRYRSATVWTAANPGIPDGGVIGESKFDIQSRLPPPWSIPTVRIPEGDPAQRMRLVQQRIAEAGWGETLVLKPEAGQRGAGVRKVQSAAEIESYLSANPGPILVQPYHPGPYEAGVFYSRMPGESHGRIFSVTDKVFPEVTGDGRSTLEELIWAHPRYRMQAAVFLDRHRADRNVVLKAGESRILGMAGNHCQGTLFRDGSHLITPDLEAAFDAIAKHFDGFFIGRFDVRYTEPAEFTKGRGFAIVELNGVTSESTNLYDPSWYLARAYWTLFRQWALLFRIGHANRQAGHRPTSLTDLIATLRDARRNRHCAIASSAFLSGSSPS